MKLTVIVATHKQFAMPVDKCYLPLFVGSKGKKSIGYLRDDTGENNSEKNYFYCELTGLYWAWKNLKTDYIGLVHYRRHFTGKPFIIRDRFNETKNIMSENEIKKILKTTDIVLPKKSAYIIESLYSHYAHTHYKEHLDTTRKIIAEKYPDYVGSFDRVMKRRSGHMYNMFIMKKSLSDDYCKWLFDILGELEKRVNIRLYSAYHARIGGRVGEILLNVWIEKNGYKYKEQRFFHLGKIHWIKKTVSFLSAKFCKIKYYHSF